MPKAIEEVLVVLRDSEKPLASARLVELSDLTIEEAKYWTGRGRRLSLSGAVT